MQATNCSMPVAFEVRRPYTVVHYNNFRPVRIEKETEQWTLGLERERETSPSTAP